jgi:hypothetical protein
MQNFYKSTDQKESSARQHLEWELSLSDADRVKALIAHPMGWKAYQWWYQGHPYGNEATKVGTWVLGLIAEKYTVDEIVTKLAAAQFNAATQLKAQALALFIRPFVSDEHPEPVYNPYDLSRAYAGDDWTPYTDEEGYTYDEIG